MLVPSTALRRAAVARPAHRLVASATLAARPRVISRAVPATAASLGARAVHSSSKTFSSAAAQQVAQPDDSGVGVSQTDSQVVISWPDGKSSTFDNQFLFDHCRCSSCFHPKTKQRLKTLGPVAPDVKARSVQIEDGNLTVTWETTPAHQSTFPLSFIHQASYDPPLASRDDLLDLAPRHLWGSSIAENPPTVDYNAVMPSEGNDGEQGVLEWLEKVHKYGFCFVTGVPADTTSTEELIRRMNFIRETHYGGFWAFTADMSKGDLAYSNEGLPAHTDTAYFTDPAGTGGETLLVDAFFVAKRLSETDPEAYETLSRLPVPFQASGNDGVLLRPPISQPILRHDHLGRLLQARWNNEDRCVLGEGWSPDEIRKWYAAARKFESIVTSKEAEYWCKLNPGTVVVIDNWRVMHGRAAFTGQRTMCGAYVGADDWRSRRRALLRKNQGDDWQLGW